MFIFLCLLSGLGEVALLPHDKLPPFHVSPLLAVRYVEFIGTSCLDPEDEPLKRSTAERVWQLLQQHERRLVATHGESSAGGHSQVAPHAEIGFGPLFFLRCPDD